MGYTYIHKSYGKREWNRSNCKCDHRNRCRYCCVKNVPGPQGIPGPPGPPGTGGVTPSVERYFHIVTLDIETTETISSNQFTNDNGELATGFLTGQNSYVNLFLNGILQPGNSYLINEKALTIIPNGGTIYEGSSIILEIVMFYNQEDGR
ncbi:DUF4183 domain-containing protein [Peribacillus loiseleuriae]|uniref:DUF4183 domain-containing protein n=1 Tax=Peribacillus loiseleuriae TaxID=1679170 RepID=UPI0006713B2E|nr:DUF4183 domain-containing protein [Peribacillus loiseleuriae]